MNSQTITQPQVYSRNNPFYATMLENVRLNKSGSQKDTRHIVLGLSGGNLRYNIGDSLGVFASNPPQLADALIEFFHWDGSQEFPAGSGHTLRDDLISNYILNRASKRFVKLVAEKLSEGNPQDNLLNLVNNDTDLTEYVYSRDYIDILREYPTTKMVPAEFVGTLVKTAPRLYSIASAQSKYPNQVHLTVVVVAYTTHGRSKYGLASGCLANLIPIGSKVPVYVQPTRHFHLPENPNTDIIMVGPGTGIAPFRAFLQQREIDGATGRNWLFFGDQHKASDFLYEEEFDKLTKSGLLTRLDTAFSRDQTHKIYVQDRIRENGAELWKWLQNGACFYICGDAKRMAKDVNQALIDIAQTHGGLSVEAATEYINTTLAKTEKRYLKDVY